MLNRLAILALLSAAALGAQNRYMLFNFDELDSTGTTEAVNVQQGGNVPDKHTVQVVVTGSPTGCATQLEGSLDNANWFDLSGSQTCTSNDMYHVVDRPVAFIRVNLATFSGGTDPTATIIYLGQTPGN